MAAMSTVPESLLPYTGISIQAVSGSTRQHLALHLNPLKESLSPNNDRLQDYRGLAEELQFSQIEIDNIALDANPTMQLFNQWVVRQDMTIGHLLDALSIIERLDILCNPKLVEMIKRDVQRYMQIEAQSKAARPVYVEPIQVDDVSGSDAVEVDEFLNITTNEEDGQPEYFDAFVSYTSADFWFVKEMIHKLEVIHGLKLCLPQRNLRPGCAKYVIMAKLIQDRCKKMIIILSPNFKNSPECEFQSRFGFALSPGAKEKKLIPVIVEPCNVPSIFQHIALLDYTKCDVIDWFWERLAKSLKKDASASAILGHRRNNPETGCSTSGSERTPFRYPYSQINTNGSLVSLSSATSVTSDFAKAPARYPCQGQQNIYSITNSSSTRTSSPRPDDSLTYLSHQSTISKPDDSLSYLSSQSSMSNSHFGRDSNSERWLMSSSEMEQDLEQPQPMEMHPLSSAHATSFESRSSEIVLIPENTGLQNALVRPTVKLEPLPPQSLRSKFNMIANKFKKNA